MYKTSTCTRKPVRVIEETNNNKPQLYGIIFVIMVIIIIIKHELVHIYFLPILTRNRPG